MEENRKQVIKLDNRYNKNLFLIQIESNKFKLYMDESIEYCSISGSERSINYIDPEGGPMICLASKINDKIVTNIEYIENNGVYLTLV